MQKNAKVSAPNVAVPTQGTSEKKDPNLYLDDMQAERRIQVLKELILAREEKQLEKLKQKYQDREEIDASRGSCCCCCKNPDGADCIMKMDMVLFFWLPRAIMAFELLLLADSS